MNQDSNDNSRYARQTILSEIGELGQEKLRQVKILVIGVGGLGAPLLLYLAAAGIGEITLIDDDRLDITNLQRQILFDHHGIGEAKVLLAEKRIAALNPQVKINAITAIITSENGDQLVQQANLVIDGSDNFTTRYLVNDLCFRHKKTLISGAVTGFDGQITTIAADGATLPCYRCLFSEPRETAENTFANCEGLGVLGPAAGVMGSLMAIEAIKIIVGFGSPLIGRLISFNALDPELHEVRYRRRSNCLTCG